MFIKTIQKMFYSNAGHDCKAQFKVNQNSVTALPYLATHQLIRNKELLTTLVIRNTSWVICRLLLN